MAQHHDVQRFDSNWSHVEADSVEEAEALLKKLRDFLEESADRSASDGRLPLRTLTFREPTGRESLTIWYHRMGGYQLRLELPGLAVTLSECEMSRVQSWGLRFFRESRELLFRDLMREDSANVRADFPGLLRALKRGRS